MKIWALGAAALVTASAHAGTIYLCKAYNGATFWSQAACSKHNALIDRIESVADVPWDQQVQQAEQAQRVRNGDAQQASSEQQRGQRCMQLIGEKNTIEGRYTNGQWQPPEVINPDQQRMRALRAELSANRCALQ